MLHEISQTQKEKEPHDLTDMQNQKRVKYIDAQSRAVFTQGRELEETGGCGSNVQRQDNLGILKIWVYDGKTVAYSVGSQENHFL